MSNFKGSCKRAALSACDGKAPMRRQIGHLSSVGNAASVRDERRVACETLELVIGMTVF
jgi:hypothetical protein